MQVFMAVVKVTVNTVEPVTPEAVKEQLAEVVSEFCGGPAEVVSVVEDE